MKFDQLLNSFDKILSSVLVIFSLILLIFIFFTSQRLVYLVFGVLTLFAGLIWLILREKVILNFESNHKNFLTFNILFFVLFTFSVISLYLRPEIYVRPLFYFILISLMAGLISLEIWVMPSKKTFIFSTIFQIIILSLNITLSQVLLFPSLLGIDPWWHQMFTLKIVALGHIPTGYPYSKIPMFHILVGLTSILSGLNYKMSVFLSITFPLIIISVLLIYTTGKSLFNEKIGLLAGLILIISNYFINACIWAIPTTLGGIFALIIIFLLLKFENKKNFLISMLSLLLLIILVMTHTIVSLIVAILLFVIWVSYIFHKKFVANIKPEPVSFTLALFFLIFILGWWIYVSGTFNTILGLIKWGFNVDPSLIKTPIEIIQYVDTINTFQQVFIDMGTFLFFFFAILGCFYMISRKYGNFKTFLIALIGITPLIISVTSIFTGHSIIEGRWLFIAQIFLAVPVASSIFMLSNSFRRKSFIPPFLCVILIIVVSFFMIMDNNVSNIDNNQFYPDGGVRLSITQSELQTVQTISSIYNKPLKADNYYLITNSSLVSKGNSQKQDISRELYYKNFTDDTNSLILIREEITNEPFWLFGTVYKLNYNVTGYLNELKFSVLYDSGSVKGYYKFKS